MNLPKQQYSGVQSLGRHDINAPLRAAEASRQLRQQNVQIVNALADTAIAFEEAHTKHQVTQAAFDFDSDRRANMEQWLGKDTYDRGSLERLGVEIKEDDTRINIPAYEVLPDVMSRVNKQALERRAGKIGNKNARSEFLARQTAALDEEGLKYHLSARQQMTAFHQKQAQIQVKELQDQGQFGPAEARIMGSPLDENEKRVALHQNRLLQETYKYENEMTRLDVPGMKESLAHLTVAPEEYKGFLPAKERGIYADSLRAAISKAESATSAKDKAEHDLLKRKARNMAELSKKGTPPTSAQINATREELVASGDVVALNGFDEDVVRYNRNVGELRYQPPNARAMELMVEDELRAAGKLSLDQQIALDQRKQMHEQQLKAFKEDPNKAWVALGGQEPIAPGTKGEDGKALPMEQVLVSWAELNQQIHAAQGTPGEDVQLIPKQYEQQFVKLFKDGNFESRKSMIQKFSTAYGADLEKHKLLWKQLGQVKNGAVYGAAGELYSRGEEATGDAMLRGVEALENKTVDASKVKLAEAMVDSKIGQTYWHDPDAFVQYRQAALALAVGMAGDEGRFDAAEKYIDNAAGAIFKEVKYRGSYIAAPPGESPRSVRNWLDDMTEEETLLHGGVSSPEWLLRGIHNGSLILKTVDSGKYAVTTATGVVVPNLQGGPLVLDYNKRLDRAADYGDSVVAP